MNDSKKPKTNFIKSFSKKKDFEKKNFSNNTNTNTKIYNNKNTSKLKEKNGNFKKEKLNLKIAKKKEKKFNKNKPLVIPEKKYPIEYKRLGLLRHFLTKYGKIRPRRVSKISLKQQRKISKAIRRARAVGLIPCLILAKS